MLGLFARDVPWLLTPSCTQLQRSGVLMLYPPPMPPTAAATSEPAPHHTFPCGGTGFEPVPSEHRGSTSSSATLLPFIAGRVHEVVSPAARVVVVSGDVAMDCVVAQLQVRVWLPRVLFERLRLTWPRCDPSDFRACSMPCGPDRHCGSCCP